MEFKKKKVCMSSIRNLIKSHCIFILETWLQDPDMWLHLKEADQSYAFRCLNVSSIQSFRLLILARSPIFPSSNESVLNELNHPIMQTVSKPYFDLPEGCMVVLTLTLFILRIFFFYFDMGFCLISLEAVTFGFKFTLNHRQYVWSCV